MLSRMRDKYGKCNWLIKLRNDVVEHIKGYKNAN